MLGGKTFLVVIPARKGSVGLPGKNYKSFLGQPLFLWSILSALNCQYVDKIIVNSCCPYVERIWNYFVEGQNESDKKKLCFRHRPEWLNGQDVKTEDIILDTLLYLQKKFVPDYITTLQPTSPCRNKQLLSTCILSVQEYSADSLLTVEKITPFLWKKGKDYIVYPHDDKCLLRPMRQQIKNDEYYFHDNGNVYITSRRILERTKNRLGGKIIMQETTKEQSLQIDDEIDWIALEAICKRSGVL